MSTKEFCFKGHKYIKFNEGRYAWGTTMLNDYGKPIICQNN